MLVPPQKGTHTVDGRNPANQLRLVVYPIVLGGSYIPGGAGFEPSTVLPHDFKKKDALMLALGSSVE